MAFDDAEVNDSAVKVLEDDNLAAFHLLEDCLGRIAMLAEDSSDHHTESSP